MQVTSSKNGCTVWEQLTVLRNEKLVATRREGKNKNIYYRVDSLQAMAVMEVLYTQFRKPPRRKSRKK